MEHMISLTNPWYTTGSGVVFHDGLAYTIGTPGIVNCFNATTGQFLWNWTAPNIGYLEVQGTTYTPLSPVFFIDSPTTNVTYLYLDGSTGWAGQTTPIRRDSALYCLDCSTGQMVWRLEAYPSVANNAASKVVINDGNIIYLDNHDNNIYCLGMGPSATTVTAPLSGASVGSSVMITGTVTDQTDSGRINSAGSKTSSSKAHRQSRMLGMEAWMEYMFQQRPMPTNATGVPVTLTAIDPNGNFISIGNVTSDITGTYGCAFTPQVPGTYHIIATFAGSNSYYSSFGECYMAANAAPATPVPAITSAPLSESAIESSMMSYTAIAAIAIIVAIAVVGMLLLKKRA